MLYAMVQHGLSAEAASALLADLDGRQASTPQQVQRAEARAANLAIVPLSEREVEILTLVAARLSNKEIARQLGISPLTVRNHTSNIYTKLNVASRKQAVALAQRLSLLPPR